MSQGLYCSQFSRGVRALACMHSLLNFKALDLAGGRPRQIVLPDFVAADSLRRSELCRQAFDVISNHFSRVDDLPLPQRFEIRNDYREELVASSCAFHPHHANFLDDRRLQIVRLDLLRINILPIRKNDDFFLTPSDEQISVSIEVPKVAGIEPTVFEHLRRG